MKNSKKNIQYLQETLSIIRNNKYSYEDNMKKIDEAIEFAEAIEIEIDEQNNLIGNLKEEINDKESEISNIEDKEPDYLNSVNLGLDTLNWDLEGGNLIISERIETFVEQLRKEYGMIPA